MVRPEWPEIPKNDQGPRGLRGFKKERTTPLAGRDHIWYMYIIYVYIYYELFIYVICIWIRFIHGWLLLLCLYMYWYVYTSPFASATWTCRKRLLGFGRTMSAVLHRPGLGKAAVLRVFFQCSHLFSSAGHHFFAGDVDKASMCHLFVHINTTSCHSPIPKIPVWEDDDRQIMENPLV